MNIDLSPKQRAIVQQIQDDSAELDQLEQRKAQLLARINANRGKLELIAELVEEYGTENATTLPDRPIESEETRSPLAETVPGPDRGAGQPTVSSST